MSDSGSEPEIFAAGVAVIGMAGRFPGAAGVEELWRNLAAGVESISSFSEEELLAAGVDRALLADPEYVRAGAVLSGIDLFDAAFFGFSPREAEITDPQQRLFLECAWEALEAAGYAGEDPGVVGVYAGTTLSTYLFQLQANPEALAGVGRFRATLGNDKDHLSTWVSYKLNLRGPAVTVQTACSTSLVAVHLACQSLLNGECDLALAGGVTVNAKQPAGYLFQEGGIHSPDGHCRAFDERARGTVGGNGAGVVVLKRLAEALADRDPIAAVIRGSAINNDGAAKLGYTAPSVEGQARVIAEALAIAEVDPATVTYVEAHGTGTSLGDPVEVEALTRAFRAKTQATRFCALGSVKTNLGHLDAAAGVTGLIKTVLALGKGKIPPSLHFERPNPQIRFEETPFYVNAALSDWERNGAPRRAGVSSFGIGGTNAHVVLEEAPEPEPPGPSRPARLLLLSARTEASLERATGQLAAYLEEHPEADLADVAYTLQVGRRGFEHRRMLVARDSVDAAAALSAREPGRVATAFEKPRFRPVAFLFPGQGAQRPWMGLGLYRHEPVFRGEVDLCAEILSPHLGFDLRTALYPEAGADAAEAAERLRQTAVAQPALFAVELALARLWMSWGVEPEAMIGHSVGQYVAACLAGVFSLEDALALVAARGRLIAGAPEGAMLAVRMGQQELAPLLPAGTGLAAVNAPDRSVAAGTFAGIEELERLLLERRVEHRRLVTSHAFHSELLDPVLPAFRTEVARIRLQPPRIPLLSNATGTWMTAGEATDPDTWVRHVREAVRFGAGMAELLAEPERVLLEVGPGQALAGFAHRAASGGGRAVVSSLPGSGAEPGDDVAKVLEALGRLWLAGVPVDWPGFHQGERRRRLPLPTYPFERQSYWVEAQRPAPAPAPAPARVPPAEPSPVERRPAILRELIRLVAELLGADAARIDPRQSFLEAGVDSLLLLQASRAIEERFGVRLTLSQLLEDVSSFEAVAAHLDRELPPTAFAPPPVPETPAVPAESAAAPGTPVERVMAEQLRALSDLMARQLDTLRALGLEGAAAPPPPSVPLQVPVPAQQPYVPYEPVSPGPAGGLDERQQAHLEAFVARYTRRTAASKRRTGDERRHFADNRSSAGFRLILKEMVYPIQVDRSRGGRFLDVDGNEYVDLTMGFGVNLFGHSPDFVDEAVRRQLDRGLAIGPQSDLAGEVARRLCALTGHERAAFCNSGTEAVMAAMRLARTATGRDKIALFAGSYHGISDGTLARTARLGDVAAAPVAPGIPPAMVEDVLVLPYGEPAALEAVAAHAGKLAAVLVEPVQSRRPDLQPAAFLADLRRLTSERGIALIFDEVITGFRVHPGGCQALFGVQADLATYGKILGGGLPIGAVAGAARFMDGIDGGDWSFGDASYPGAVKTYFAGTFCKHPLAMAAAGAVLAHLEREGPALQERLTRRTAELCADLNAFSRDQGYPLQATHFGSLFRLTFPDRSLGPELFYYHLVDRGVYVWEGRTSFVATAHTEEDLRRVREAVRDSLAELREAGFFPGGPPRPRPRSFPLTEGQRQIWFLAQLGEEASRAYNESVTVELDGPLDPAALGAALGELTARHEALRTAIGRDGEAQTVLPAVELPLPLVDLTEPGASAEAAALVAREAARSFDLSSAPLMRALLLRTAPERHRLVLTLHHVVVDGWSYGVLLRELALLYSAASTGEPHGLPAPPRFSDYARRLSERPADLAPEERTAEAVPFLELPLDRPRPAVRTFRGGMLAGALPASRLAALRELGARRGATLLTVLVAGYGALLHRLSGQRDLLVGTASAGQLIAGTDALVGYCVERSPVRLAPEPEASFESFLAGVKAELLSAHERRSSGRSLSSLRPGHDPSRLLLVAAAFNLDRTGSGGLGFSGLESRVGRNHPGASKFELFLNVIETPGELRVEWEHNLDLFRPTTIRRWMDAFETLLAGAAADPRQRLADLPLLSAAERHQLLFDWNDTAEAGEAACLHEMFAAAARLSPRAPALRFEGEGLTYGELAARAGRLARLLRRLGVGPEVRVGIYLGASFDRVVSLLAVLAAGGAYVPLDPGYPPERLAHLVGDCGAPVVITRSELRDRLGPAGARVVVLDEEEGDGTPEEAWPASGVTAGNTAYVIYTSGSTGQPNGVLVPHGAAANLIRSARAAFQVGPGSRVLQSVAFGFDASVLETFLALAHGACLCLVREEEKRTPAALAARMVSEGVTTAVLVPSLLAVLPEPELRGLRSLSVGGEACPGELVARWAPERRMLNCYGPTEAAIYATVEVCRGSEDRAPSLGRPVPNVRAHLLDRELRPVPIGVPGEVVLGGAGLARGYLGEPAKTAERFLPDPFSAAPGERLYRTGDLARRLPDGRLEFLGRGDDQIKVRGVRIELGEVEAVLAGHPAVAAAVAAAREDLRGEKRLVAYVVPRPGETAPTAAGLRAFLAARLPEPMLPTAFVPLEAVPLTPSGKLDRRALPPPPEERAASSPELVEPGTPLEHRLAGIWREILGVERIGVHDDFFARGGDSIRAARLVNRLQSELSEIVHVVALFDAPTIRALADLLTERYPRAVARLSGIEEPSPEPAAPARPAARIDEAWVTAFRALIPPLPPRRGPEVEKNPPALFLLSPPRSGSTLLRVMLGGHPRLFAPPELELLSFNTLAERKAAFSGRLSFWLEGTLRTLMEVEGLDLEGARRLMEEHEAAGWTVQRFYRKLQEGIGDRLLVDKTPAYALDAEILRRAESDFREPRYLHLLRHPHAVLRSFEEARLDEVFFRHPHPFSSRQLAELIWTVSHRNILRFLAEIPAGRQHVVRFEELVADPERVLSGLCRFLDLPFEPGMLRPYEDPRRRMTDGVHALSRMLGDVKFHSHQGIDPGVADRWRRELTEDFLGEVTWETARRLGYRREPGPETAAGGGRAPLSFAQERLWFLDRLDPGSAAYNIATAVRLSGRLDAGILAASLTEVVRRHEALRTRFEEVSGEPFQVVLPAAPAFLPQVDLEGLPEPLRAAEADRLARAEARRPFDLSRGPLLRTTLLRLGAGEHTVLVTLHHAASDGWSMGIFVREVGTLYTALAQGLPAKLPELPLQYAGFAAWQRRWLAGEALEGQLAYWRERLAGAPARLALPLDHPRPPVRTGRGGVRPWSLPAPVAEGLLALGRSRGATLFMVLLAGLDAFFHRITGEESVVLGAPVSGRNRPEIEGLIGLFVNTLALRVQVIPGLPVGALLDRARQATVEAYAHQDLPFEKLVEEVAPERSLSHAPVFQVLFALQNAPLERLQIPGLTLESTPPETGTAKLDLAISVSDTGRGLSGGLEFDRDLFEPATAARMVRHLSVLFEALAGDPSRVADLRVADLPLLSAAERHQLEREWNDTAAERTGPATVVERFAIQAARSPEALAVVCEESGWTYGELARRAGRLARRLRREGAARDRVVAVCCERSLEMAAALLGTLASGAAYLPLDPALPADRLAFLLDDADAFLAVTVRELAESLPVLAGEGRRRVLLLGDEDSEGEEALLPAPAAGDLAYVLYTSGSTGRPKAVMVEHGNLANVLEASRAAFGWDSGDVMPCLAPYSFDIFLFELLNPLLAGGTAVLVPLRPTLDLDRLVSGLGRFTRLHAVPALMRQIVEAAAACKARGERFDRLRTLFVGGDAVPAELLAALRSVFPEAGIRVLYGPTEGTIICSSHAVPAGEETPRPLLGRPLQNLTLRVLTADGNLAPIGVPGELLLGGLGVTRGYLGRGELTAERYPIREGERLYRTGDLARRLPDGTLEFLGRADNQVKIRGFRVEPGEIEAVLAGQPGVAECAVVVRVDRPGDPGLAAFFVAEPGAEPAADALRDGLRAALPDYMVPPAIVRLEALPLLSTGKVDRKALARLAPEPEREAAGFAAPRTATEELLATLWAAVLGAGRVGAADHFFDLGGHSLLALRLISRVRAAFGVELPVRALFASPVLSGLAAVIDRARAGGEGAAVPPVLPVPRHGPLPLSFAQERLWFLDRLEPGSSGYNMPLAVWLAGELDPAALAASLSGVVRRHEALRTRFAEEDGRPLQVIEPPRPVPLPWIDLAALPEERREAESFRLAALEARRPFDLARGPLLRATLLRMDPSRHLVLLTLHHIAGDGWSMALLVREIGALYAAAVAGRPARLAPLPVQYADFAVWQRERLSGPALEAEVAYWRERLAGLPPLLALPTDRPRGAVQSTRGARFGRGLAAAASDGVRALCRSEGATLFMTLSALLAAQLHRDSGQDDVPVGTPVANRSRPEVEELIGLFLNTLVLRVSFAGRPDTRELLAAVRETALSAYAHQEVPFEKLVEELQPERSRAYTPLFQVMLVVQEAPLPAIELPGLRLAPAPAAGGGADQLGMMTVTIGGGRELAVSVGYNRDLFDATTIARLVDHLESLIAAAAADPGRPLAELPRLSEAELHQVCREWNDTRTALPETLVHRRIEEQARRAPGAPAVLWNGEVLTYGDLDRRANRLASHLRALGVGPERIVAVCLERSFDLIVALLAIWKAGGAYLPLDPASPRERRAAILDDAGAAVLVTTGGLVAEPEAGPAAVVRLDRDRDAIERASASPPEVSLLPGHLAYVIYTSGSTGTPKGVLIEQESVANIVASFVASYRLSEADRVLQQTTLAFDVSVNEIFPVLTAGGGLVLASGLEVLDFEALVRRIEDEGITILGAAPSVLARLNEAVGSRPLGRLRLILSGGEALSWEDVDRLQGSVRVVNGYGPTEATVCSLSFDLEGLAPGARIPIGRPLVNYEAYGLDREGNLLGPGPAGELAIGGAGLARGYLGNPALTAEKFVPHPLEPGARVYRTGDLARWLADGTVEFLGRIDRQLKIRGFRIEPGEIEAALAGHPQVREAVVVAREDTPGHRRLVAYAVASPGAAPEPPALRAWLEPRLPGYMVPAAFVLLPELPLTASGKVDVPSLPAPDALAAASGRTARVVPRDETEQQLARIWEDLLGSGPVSVDADFFELGGHSLLAVRMMALVGQRLGRSLPIAALFQAPTIEKLAPLLRQETAERFGSPLVAIQPRGGNPPLFCIHPIGGEVFVYRRLAQRLGPGQPVYGLQAPNLMTPADLATSIEDMAERYVEAVRQAWPRGPYLLAGWSFGCVVAFEMAQQLRRAGLDVPLLALLDGVPPRRRRGRRLSAPVLLAQLLREDARQREQELDLSLSEIARLPYDKGMRLVLHRARGMGLVPADMSLGLARRFLAGFRARSAAADRYRPEVYPGPITFIRAGRRDADLPAAAEPADPARGWSELSALPVEAHTVDTHHDLLLNEPAVGRVAELLADCVARALDSKTAA